MVIPCAFDLINWPSPKSSAAAATLKTSYYSSIAVSAGWWCLLVRHLLGHSFRHRVAVWIGTNLYDLVLPAIEGDLWLQLCCEIMNQVYEVDINLIEEFRFGIKKRLSPSLIQIGHRFSCPKDSSSDNQRCGRKGMSHLPTSDCWSFITATTHNPRLTIAQWSNNWWLIDCGELARDQRGLIRTTRLWLNDSFIGLGLGEKHEDRFCVPRRLPLIMINDRLEGETYDDEGIIRNFQVTHCAAAFAGKNRDRNENETESETRTTTGASSLTE